MELVLVAVITAGAATVPQVLTWLQNRKRDDWERDRDKWERKRVEREDAQAAADREAARQAVVDDAVAACCRAVDVFERRRIPGSSAGPVALDALSAVNESFETLCARAEPQSSAHQTAVAVLEYLSNGDRYDNPYGVGDELLRARASLLGVPYRTSSRRTTSIP